MMTYLSVVFLTVLSLIVMVLVAPLVVRDEQVRIWGLPPAVQAQYDAQANDFWEKNPAAEYGLPAPVAQCAWHTETRTNARLDQIWWISLVNPFVIVADAAPLPPGATQDLGQFANRSSDPLAWIRYSVRRMAQPQPLERDECTGLYSTLPGYQVAYNEDGTTSVTTSNGTPVDVNSPVKPDKVSVDAPIWPWGLGGERPDRCTDALGGRAAPGSAVPQAGSGNPGGLIGGDWPGCRPGQPPLRTRKQPRLVGQHDRLHPVAHPPVWPARGGRASSPWSPTGTTRHRSLGVGHAPGRSGRAPRTRAR